MRRGHVVDRVHPVVDEEHLAPAVHLLEDGPADHLVVELEHQVLMENFFPRGASRTSFSYVLR